MLNNRVNSNCSDNLLYVRFNEEFGRDDYVYFDMQYPSLFNISGQQNAGNPGVLRGLNTAIKKTVDDFKTGIYEEASSYNKTVNMNSQVPSRFNISSRYAITFSMNSILSCILDLKGSSASERVYYNTLNNYNIDLISGRELTLADVFNSDVDYIDFVSEYIESTIAENPHWYYVLSDFEIPESQAFYLTFDGVVIYFGLDEIAPADFGIPRFKISYSDYASKINPKFLCAF